MTKLLSLVDPFLSTSAVITGFRVSRRALVEVGTNMYYFYIDGGIDLVYKKSTNRGLTWSAATVIEAGTYEFVDVWFDKWTPGDTGNIIHIWAISNTTDDVEYFSLDTSNDTLGNSGNPIVVFNGASVSTISNVQLSGAKARGGNLYVAFDIDGGTETGFYRSTDNGANWTSRSNVNEASNTDFYLLFPGNESDNQDMWCVFWDISTDEISLKTYDDSGDAWAETSISTGMVDTGFSGNSNNQFFGYIDPTNNHLMLCAWNAYDSSTADLKTWDINGAGSITAKTDVHTNVNNCAGCVLTYTPSWIECTYLGKSDSSESPGSSVGVYQKRSYDGMTTWSGEYTVFNDTKPHIRFTTGSPISMSRVMPTVVWHTLDYLGSAQESFFTTYFVSNARAKSQVGV